MGEPRREAPPVETGQPLKAGAAQPLSPYLEPAQSDWIHPIAGYCKGLHRDLRMIPTVAEYRALCSTADHVSCPIYRTRGGEGALKIWLMVRYQLSGGGTPLRGG